MGAQRLRDAAAKIRETAQGTNDAVGEGTWTICPTWRDVGALRWQIDSPDWTVGATGCEEQATHIALWSPPVALAVADWLDMQAGCDGWHEPDAEALILADLILGDQ